MQRRSVSLIAFHAFTVIALSVFLPSLSGGAQSIFQVSSTQEGQGAQYNDAGANTELQTGIDLARQGRFSDAIPHLLAAQGRVSNEFAADFNLALCYVATGQNQSAIPLLHSVLSAGHTTAGVYDLLAQALIGVSQPEKAFKAFQRGVALDPTNEKLYLLVVDSCMDRASYDLALKVVDTGLRRLPGSARLHYQKGILLSFLDRPDNARQNLKLARELAPGTTISFLAEAQEGLLDGTIPQAISAARDGLRKEPENYILLTILGQALIRQGVSPAQAEFNEAQTALEKSVAERPNYAVSQLALGQIYLMGDYLSEAITHLEKARQLAPDNSSAYSQLAAAYRRRGDLQEAEKMLAVLAGLNREQAAKYKLDPRDHKGSYLGSPKQ